MTHIPCDTDLLHDSFDGVSDLHRGLTGEQVEVLAILGWCSSCGHARLTRHQRQILDGLIAWRHEPPAVPVPRPPTAVS